LVGEYSRLKKPGPGTDEVGDGAGVTVLPSTNITKGVNVGRLKSWVGIRIMVAVALGLGVLVMVGVSDGTSVGVAVGGTGVLAAQADRNRINSVETNFLRMGSIILL
jgi:hypothetical protein